MTKKQRVEILNKQSKGSSNRRIDAFLAYTAEEESSKKLLLKSIFEKRKKEDEVFLRKYIKEIYELFKT